jgi:hypothetical protein
LSCHILPIPLLHSNLHSFSLSFVPFTTYFLPTIFLFPILFPRLFIYTRKLQIHRTFRRNTFQLRNKEM